jgi:hypothetical protein
LLIPDHFLFARHRGLFATLWLGTLLFPLGYWGRPSRSIAGAWVAVIAVLLLAPSVTGLLSTPLSQLAAAAGGAAAGHLARWGLRADAPSRAYSRPAD